MEGHYDHGFQENVLKKTLGPMRDKVSGGWRLVHNEELHNLYSSPNVITVII
jgi:hypothetical protein